MKLTFIIKLVVALSFMFNSCHIAYAQAELLNSADRMLISDETKAYSLEASKLNVNGEHAESNAEFFTQIIVGENIATSYSFSDQTPIHVIGRIRIAPDDVGKEAEIIVVALYDGAFFVKSEAGWQSWAGQLDTLKAIKEPQALQAIEDIDIAADLAMPGLFKVFLGYRINGDLHHSKQGFDFYIYNSLVDENQAIQLGSISILSTDGTSFQSTANFLGQFAANNQILTGNRFSTEPAVDIFGRIYIADENIGQTGKILRVALYQGALYMKTPTGWVPWNGQLASLVSAEAPRAFKPIEDIEFERNLSLTGEFDLFFGYRVNNQLYYNGKPLVLALVEDGGDNVVTPTPTPTTLAGFEISTVTGHTAEYGSVAEFYVRLTSAPIKHVIIPVASSNTNEGVTDQAELVFTSESWQQPQTIVVRGRNSAVVNGHQDYQIILSPVQSNDSAYRGLDPDDIAMQGIVLELNAPDLSMPFIANITAQIDLTANYNGQGSLNFALLEYPENVQLNALNGQITWTPSEVDSGHTINFKARVTDGTFSAEQHFRVSVAVTTPLATSVQGNRITVTEGSLNGFSIEAQSATTNLATSLAAATDISTTQIETIPAENAPVFPEWITPISDVFVIKGSPVGDEFIVELPLQGVPEDINLHRVKLYHYAAHGSHVSKPFWGTRGYAKEIDWTPASRKVSITLGSVSGVFVLGLESEQESVATPQNITLQPKINAGSLVDSSNIICILGTKLEPRIHPLTQALIYVEVDDYDDQVCTTISNPNTRIRVTGFGPNTRWDGMTIRNLITWLLEIQEKLNTLGLSYDKDIEIKLDINSNDSAYMDPKESNKVLHVGKEFPKTKELIKPRPLKELISSVLAHEYFHNAQARTQNVFGQVLYETQWMTEGMAVWFENFVYENSNLFKIEVPVIYRILEAGAMANGEHDKYGSRPYDRFAIWKLLQQKCQQFGENSGVSLSDVIRVYKPFYLTYDYEAEVGTFDINLPGLSTLLSDQCEFGEFLGDSNKAKLETGLLWYQYVTLVRNDFTLLGYNKLLNPFVIQDTPHKFNIGSNEYTQTNSLVGIYPVYSAQSFRIMPTNANGQYSMPGTEEWVLTIPAGNERLIVSLIDYDKTNLLEIDASTNHFVQNSSIDNTPMIWFETGANGQNEIIFKSGSTVPRLFVTIVNPSSCITSNTCTVSTGTIELAGDITLERRPSKNAAITNPFSPLFVPNAKVAVTSVGALLPTPKSRIARSTASANEETKEYKNFTSFFELMDNFGFKLNKEIYNKLNDGSLKLNQLTVHISGNTLIDNGLLQPYSTGAVIDETLNAVNIDAAQFSYDTERQRYVLPFSQLFSTFDFGTLDNSLVTLDVTLSGEVDGQNSESKRQFTYATVTNLITEIPAGVGDISGQVNDTDGKPLTGVAISLMPLGTTLYTNSLGAFTFNDVATGSYHLVISKEGYADVKVDFGLSGEDFSRTGAAYTMAGTGFDITTQITLLRFLEESDIQVSWDPSTVVVDGSSKVEVQFSSGIIGGDVPDDPINTYLWDFGDGTTQLIQAIDGNLTVEHVFDRLGEHTVSLTITSQSGQKVTKQLIVDVQHPSIEAPQNLRATAKYGAIELTWDLVENATRYNLHYSSAPSLPQLGTVHEFRVQSPYTVSDLVNGKTYHFALTAEDIGGGESVYSELASAAPTKSEHIIYTSDNLTGITNALYVEGNVVVGFSEVGESLLGYPTNQLWNSLFFMNGDTKVTVDDSKYVDKAISYSIANIDSEIVLSYQRPTGINYGFNGPYKEYNNNIISASENIFLNSNWGFHTSIDTDSSGKTHVIQFGHAGYFLNYSTNKSGSWVNRNISDYSIYYHYPKLTIDNQDIPHIITSQLNDSYGVKGRMQHWYNNNTVWTSEIISTNSNGHGKLIFDAQNNIYGVYVDTSDNLKLISQDSSGSWVFDTIDSGLNLRGRETRVAISPDNTLYVVAKSNDGRKVFLFTEVGGQWIRELINDSLLPPTNDSSKAPSILFGESNKPIVVYADDTTIYKTRKPE